MYRTPSSKLMNWSRERTRPTCRVQGLTGHLPDFPGGTPAGARETRALPGPRRDLGRALVRAVACCVIALGFGDGLRAEEASPPEPAASTETAATPTTGPMLTMDEAIERALAHNFTIKVDSFLVPLAESDLSAAKARFDPYLYFNYRDNTRNEPGGTEPETGQPFPASVLDTTTYSAGLGGELPLGLSYEIGGSTTNSRGDFPGFPSANFDEVNTGVNATVRLPLLRGFGRAATLTTIRIARTDRNISEWEFRATVINTITDVIYAYNNLLLAHATVGSARRSRDLAAQLQAENERRHGLGYMSEYDVLSARARVATREDQILIYERFVKEAEYNLKQLISDDTSPALWSTPVNLPPQPTAQAVNIDPTADLAIALQKRPDFQQAQLQLQRNEYNLRYYRNQLLPTVELIGSYGYNGSGPDFATTRDVISDRSFPAYSTGVTISIPLTSAAERARYRGARFARQQAEMRLQQLEQSIVVNVGNAAHQIETTWRRVLATRASRELSQQTLDAEVKKLRAGTSSTFVVLQQQEILGLDEVREARALSDYRNALAEYDRQLGRTLETFQIQLDESP